MDELMKRKILEEARERYSSGGSLSIADWAGEDCEIEEAGFRSFISRYVNRLNSRGPAWRLFSLNDETLNEIYRLSTVSPIDKIVVLDGKRVNLTAVAESIYEDYRKSGSKKDIAVIGKNKLVENGSSLTKLIEFEVVRFAPTRVFSIESSIDFYGMFYEARLEKYLN